MELWSAYPVNTDHRAGRMLAALIGCDAPRASLSLTVRLTASEGQRAYHETFVLRRWVSDSSVNLSVEVKGSGDYRAGVHPIKVCHYSVSDGRFFPARDERGKRPMLQYAAEAAVRFAWSGEVPQPTNGTVEVMELDRCVKCGSVLKDPVSLERGYGPECWGERTGSRTIRGQEALPV